jgi:regulator of protease activity HflC (stomatin/prohibitin superfamily)
VARQSVNVDAIVFWLVWNAEKSILEVADFIEAITLSAQTALRGGEHPQNCVAQNHR